MFKDDIILIDTKSSGNYVRVHRKCILSVRQLIQLIQCIHISKISSMKPPNKWKGVVKRRPDHRE